nr:helix-turn-helix domain-containing protein [Candidatus Krumholzibacteria bacterium]
TAHFLDKYAGRYQRPVRAFSADAMAALMSHDYPGNVRELENIVEQSVVMAPEEMVHQADLPGYLGGARASAGSPIVSPDQVNGDLPGLLEALEKRIVHDTLARFEGNQSSAARHLGLTESGLRYKLGKWREG